MKKSIHLLPAILFFFMVHLNSAQTIAASSPFMGIIPSDIDWNVQSGFNYDWWECDNDDKGGQFYIPIRVETDLPAFSCSLLGAYAYTTYDPAEGSSKSLSATTDTKLNLSYALSKKLPVDLLFGLDFNFPTGKTKLDSDELGLIMDPDLISINSFGEGFNINPTISLLKEWESWSLASGIGYFLRGEYDFSETLENYDPGDIYNFTVDVEHTFLSDWRIRCIAEYVYFEKDQVESEDYFQEGDFFLFGVGVNYVKTTWDASGTLYSITRGKSKFREGTNLITEAKKESGDEWIADISHRYFFSKEISLKSGIQSTYVMENDYSSGTSFFAGKKQKVLFKVGVNKTGFILPTLDAELALTLKHLNEEKSWMHPNEDLSYKGFSIGGMVVSRF